MTGRPRRGTGAGGGGGGGEEPPTLRHLAFAALTGRSPDSGRASGDVRQMITSTYGTTKRGGPNTRAAAEGLGVSQRQVQRWLRGDNQPSATHRTALSDAAGRAQRHALDTRTGRGQAIRSSDQYGTATANGARISIRGMQGPVPADTPGDQKRDYVRQRTVTWDLGPEDMQALYASYEKGGHTGLRGFLRGWGDENYVADWDFESIDDIRF